MINLVARSEAFEEDRKALGILPACTALALAKAKCLDDEVVRAAYWEFLAKYGQRYLELGDPGDELLDDWTEVYEPIANQRARAIRAERGRE